MATDYHTTTVEAAAAFERYHNAPVADLPTPDEYLDRPERDEHNECPECEDGIISVVGREYGRDMYACDRCSWSS